MRKHISADVRVSSKKYSNVTSVIQDHLFFVKNKEFRECTYGVYVKEKNNGV